MKPKNGRDGRDLETVNPSHGGVRHLSPCDPPARCRKPQGSTKWNCIMIHWLVGGMEMYGIMEFYIFLWLFIQLGMSWSQLTKSYFSEGWLNHQPDDNWSQWIKTDDTCWWLMLTNDDEWSPEPLIRNNKTYIYIHIYSYIYIHIYSYIYIYKYRII